MIDPSGKTYINLAPAPGAAPGAVRQRDDNLYRAVRDTVASEYELLGELGRGRGGTVVYLARELASGQLVALRLDRGASGADADYELTVVPQLDESIPAVDSDCPYCGRRVEGWARFCPQCGRDISGEAGSETSAYTPEQLLEAVRASASGDYEVLGEMTRARGGGRVYFARDLATGAIVALRLQRERSAGGEDQFSLGRTQVLKPLVADLGAEYASPTVVASPAAPPPRAVTSGAPGGAPDRTGAGANPATAPASRATPASAPARPAAPPPEGRTVVGLAPATPSATPPVYDAAPAEPQLPGRRKRTLLIAAGATVAVIGAVLLTLSGGDDATDFGDSTRVPDSSNVVRQPPVVDTAPRPKADTVIPEPPDDRGVLAMRGTLPPGATVLIDGRPVSGRVVSLPLGRHTVAVRARGYEPFSQRVEVTADTTTWSPQLRLAQAPPRTDSVVRPRVDSQPRPPEPTCARSVTAQDWENARTLCRRDAGAGNAAAQRELGILLLRGLGGAPDEAGAVNWLRRAADADDAQAQFELGRIYQSRRAYRDDRRAYEMFRRAAMHGHQEAQLQAGRALERGIGVSQNVREAFLLYEQAAKSGYAAAQNAYGIFLKKGIGTARDDKKALEWLMKAAQGGSADAHFHIGELYEEGRAGLPKSRTTALEWYRKGAALGSEEARRALQKR